MRVPARALSALLLGALAGCVTPALAQPRAAASAPAVVLLRGAPDAARTSVVLERPGVQGSATVLGTFPHLPSSARHAALLRGPSAAQPVVLAVAAETDSPRGGSYHSALFRIDPATAATTRLCGELADGSRPLVTARGTVLLQRGHDGEDPAPEVTRRRLVERTDALRLDAVDPTTGSLRPVWSGRGQLAFLATALRDDEVLVYLLQDAGSSLLRLDVRTGDVALLHPDLSLARDFSYDAARDEVVFARALSPTVYEVASMRAHDPSPAAITPRWRSSSDHLMPRVLRDGTIGLSLPGDHGLGWLPRGASAQSTPAAFAPRGDGSDALLSESDDGRWIALRHTTDRDESVVVAPRRGGVAHAIASTGEVIEFVGFAGGAR